MKRDTLAVNHEITLKGRLHSIPSLLQRRMHFGTIARFEHCDDRWRCKYVDDSMRRKRVAAAVSAVAPRNELVAPHDMRDPVDRHVRSVGQPSNIGAPRSLSSTVQTLRVQDGVDLVYAGYPAKAGFP